MTPEYVSIFDFCRLLALVGKQFRGTFINVRDSGKFASVTDAIGISDIGLARGHDRTEKAEVSFELTSKLKGVRDDGKSSFDLAIAVCCYDGTWTCNGDLGWSNENEGYEEETSTSIEFPTLAELKQGLPEFVQSVLRQYEGFIRRNF